MHNCIIQIDKESFDDREDDLITSDDFINSFDWFVPEIADYVRDFDNDEETLENIKYTLDRPGLRYADGKLTIVSKEAYFLDRYKEFIDIARDVCQWSLDDFISGKKWMEISTMYDLYDDKFCTYIADGYHGITTLDDFIRDCENGTEFYVGNALDYHF